MGRRGDEENEERRKRKRWGEEEEEIRYTTKGLRPDLPKPKSLGNKLRPEASGEGRRENRMGWKRPRRMGTRAKAREIIQIDENAPGPYALNIALE
uniref:Uncharacterized protein n=1 Tax=Oryza sativa subsp. japonica TaxID=39947 RepID=Q69KB0_ORYSJ|nr:hypothetical protein [Oryza sativa Japonica Group]